MFITYKLKVVECTTIPQTQLASHQGKETARRIPDETEESAGCGILNSASQSPCKSQEFEIHMGISRSSTKKNFKGSHKVEI
jgi:hypothetical protein